MHVGAHVSVGQGYRSALDYACSVGCECMQIFAKSPRQWRGPELDPEAVAEFAAERERRGFGPLFTHTAYLINLSTDDDELRENSTIALADELRRGSLLGAAGVVTHIGNDPSGDPVAAARRAGDAILRAFEAAGGDECRTKLLLENTAGAGRTFGGSFEEIAETIRVTGLDPDRVGMCFDTCHAFAYGLGVDSASGWSEIIGAIRDTVGLDRLRLIHANDCLFERGSRRDRHAWIAEGRIGAEGFGAMMCQPALRDLSVVTEMPGEAPAKDAVNIARLVAMRSACDM